LCNYDFKFEICALLLLAVPSQFIPAAVYKLKSQLVEADFDGDFCGWKKNYMYMKVVRSSRRDNAYRCNAQILNLQSIATQPIVHAITIEHKKYNNVHNQAGERASS
jgi:hypothetical protein